MSDSKPTDAPAAPDDWLDYHRYADSLWSRVHLALASSATAGDASARKARSGLPTADPLVVGIYGEWGAGKSRLLELVYHRAAAENAKVLAQRILDPGAYAQGKALYLTVPVWFHSTPFAPHRRTQKVDQRLACRVSIDIKVTVHRQHSGDLQS